MVVDDVLALADIETKSEIPSLKFLFSNRDCNPIIGTVYDG
jgi:hypothetical protein